MNESWPTTTKTISYRRIFSKAKNRYLLKRNEYTINRLPIFYRLKSFLVIIRHNEPIKFNSPHILLHLLQIAESILPLYFLISNFVREIISHTQCTLLIRFGTQTRVFSFSSFYPSFSIRTCPGSLYSNILKSPPIWNSCSMRFIGK